MIDDWISHKYAAKFYPKIMHEGTTMEAGAWFLMWNEIIYGTFRILVTC